MEGVEGCCGACGRRVAGAGGEGPYKTVGCDSMETASEPTLRTIYKGSVVGRLSIRDTWSGVLYLGGLK